MKTKLVIVTLIICMLLVIVPTVINVTENYNNNLINVTEKRITEAAILCVKEDNCSLSKVYLCELYELNYLENESDPITKEYYDENSYVIFTNNEATFITVN